MVGEWQARRQNEPVGQQPEAGRFEDDAGEMLHMAQSTRGRLFKLMLALSPASNLPSPPSMVGSGTAAVLLLQFFASRTQAVSRLLYCLYQSACQLTRAHRHSLLVSSRHVRMDPVQSGQCSAADIAGGPWLVSRVVPSPSPSPSPRHYPPHPRPLRSLSLSCQSVPPTCFAPRTRQASDLTDRGRWTSIDSPGGHL